MAHSPRLDPAAPTQPAATALLLPSGQLELSRLVDLASQRLNVKLTYDEQLLKPKVTLRLPSALSDQELWGLTNRLLAEQGLVTARLGGSNDPALAVVKIAAAAQLVQAEPFASTDAALPGGSDATSASPYLPSFRKLAVKLAFVSGKDAAAAVAPLLSKPGGTATEDSSGRSLIIADLSGHAEAAARAVLALDAPALEVKVTAYKCVHLGAPALVTLATQVVSKRDGVGGGGSSALAGGSGAVGGGAAPSSSKGAGDLIAAPDGRTLLVLAPADRVDSWLELLGRLDQREAVETHRYAAGDLPASDAARLIEQTVAASKASQPASDVSDDRWTVAADEASGTLLVTGTPSQHALVERTLSALASAPPEVRRPLRTFVLKHRSVREVIGIIDRLIDVGILDSAAEDGEPAGPDAASTSDSPGTVRVPPPPAASPKPSTATVAVEPKDSPLLRGMTRGSKGSVTRSGEPDHARGDSLTLTADEATNTLIAVGEPRVLAQLETLLPTLDVRQPQVMIEAVLVSLSDSQTMQLGVELEKIELSGGTLIRLASLFGLSSAGTGANAGSRTVGDAAGFSGVVLNPGDFSVIIRALETVNEGRALSVPRVLVNNNQQATFNSTLQQPFASTNASDTVATTSFGGTFDAGTTISVRPQIAEGDHLVLDYQVKLSSFTGSATVNLPPPRQENSITSIATIPDGYTVVVGGLEAITDGEGESGVPGIGAIPIIGELFKNRTNQRSRARFFVFLRANVMRGTSGTGFEELKYMSDRAAESAGVAKDWDGWPELAPRVIR